MKSIATLTGAAVMAMAIIDAPAANAATKFFITPGPAVWSATANWNATSCAGGGGAAIPGATDDVVICRGNIATIDQGFTILSMIIEEQAVVDFDGIAADVLTITATDGLAISRGSDPGEGRGTLDMSVGANPTRVDMTGGGVMNIDGKILLGGGEAASVLLFSAETRLAGIGRIVGQNDNAEIQLNNITLTNEIRIEGQLTIGLITTLGTFVNDGVVEATVPDGTLSLQDNNYWRGRGVYQVLTLDAILEFHGNLNDACLLTADFRVSGGGSLNIDENLITTGILWFLAGEIEVITGKSATWN